MRNYGIDLLRGIAAFGIVGCHLRLSPMTTGGEIVCHFCDFNVAVFAVVAGMLTSDGGGVKYILKRVRRIVPTYLVWSAVYIAASMVFQVFGGGVEARFSEFKYWVSVLLCGSASCHLWFLICLLYAQTIVTVIGRLMNGVAWLVLGVLFVVFATLGDSWYHVYLTRLFGFVCIGKAIGCGVMGKWQMVGPVRWGVVAAVCLVSHIALSNSVPDFTRDLVAVVPVVLLFRAIGEVNAVLSPSFVRVASFLASSSMAVFLIHPIFTRIGSVVVSKFCTAPYSTFVVLLDWMLCWLVAIGFATVVIRVPCLRKVCQ